MRSAIILSILIAIVLTWVAVSTSDFYEARQQHRQCLSMVEQGAWPEDVC